MSQLFKNANLTSLSVIGLVCIFFGLLFSRALISIGMIIMLIPVFNPYTLKDTLHRFSQNPVYLCFLLFLLLVLISGVYSNDQESFWRHFRVKVPFLTLPLAFAALPKLNRKTYLSLLYGFFLLMVVSAFWSVGMLLSDMPATMEAIRVGKVPYTPIHHIRYSLMLVLSVGIAYMLVLEKFQWIHRIERWVIIALGAALFVYIHILAVRSGWLALYLLIGVLGLRYIVTSKKYLLVAGIVIVMLVTPLIAYYTIPTIRNKVSYMQYDWDQFIQGKYEGQNNDTRRLRSIAAGIAVGNENWLTGVGMGDVEHATIKKYGELYPEEKDKNKVSPHNQFIFIYVGVGIGGLLTLLIMSFLPLFYQHGYKQLLLLIISTIIISSYLTEHTIEVQIGVAFYLVFLLLGINQTEKSA